MAKKSLVAREHKRQRLQKKYAALRANLKKMVKSADASFEERTEAQQKLQTIPTNALPVRAQRRCVRCERPRAVYRKFKLCRICLRELLMTGWIPGGRKSSW